ncbi:transposase [Streptomyces sp. 2RAF24]|uniref:transposase n=1 Tax=Streptomyces sp. 2RAF24 TaxID=3232997 RepID=UPI003F9881C7
MTSKIHLACDGQGRPPGFVVTGGNSNDRTRCAAVMGAIKAPRIGPGRPRIRPDHVLGDKGYSSKPIRSWLRRLGIPHTIPERAAQARNRARRASRGGRPPALDREIHRQRNVMERCFNRLKQLVRHHHPLRRDRPVLRGRRHARLTPDVGLTFDDRP